MVCPARIELTSKESESFILSVKLWAEIKYPLEIVLVDIIFLSDFASDRNILVWEDNACGAVRHVSGTYHSV